MDLGTDLCGKTNHAIVTYIYEIWILSNNSWEANNKYGKDF